MPPLLKRVLFVVGILFLTIYLASKILINPVLANIYGYSDANQGWGTSANATIPMDTRLDSRGVRTPWYYLERTNNAYTFGGIYNLIDDAINQNKKVAVGIMLKGNAAYRSSNGNGCFGEADCFDGTPEWVVDLAPLYDTVTNQKMINYIDSQVQQQITELVENLTLSLSTRYPTQSQRDHFTILVCTGMDCEAQPEQNPHDQIYITTWGPGDSDGDSILDYEKKWIDFVSWIVDVYDQKMNLAGMANKVRYLVISANFKDYRVEKPAYINYLTTKTDVWGLYSAGVSAGFKLFRYGEPHSSDYDETLSANLEVQDIFRKYCLTRPCIGEHGDAYEPGTTNDNTKIWPHWWRAASALWQRIDAYYTLRAWALGTSYPTVRDFFNTYAGKSYYDSPKAWVILHQDYQDPPPPIRYPQRNFTFYLDQFESDNINNLSGRTSPEWSFCNVMQPSPTPPIFEYPCTTRRTEPDYQITNLNPIDAYQGIFTRKTRPGRVMAFRATSDFNNKSFINDGPHNVRLEVTYLDYGNDTLTLWYNSATGIKQALSINKAANPGTQWTTVQVTLPDAMFNQGIDGADFYIDDNNDGDEYIHWASVEYVNGNPNPTPTIRPTGPPGTPPPGVTTTPSLSGTPTSTPGSGTNFGSLVSGLNSPIGLLLVIALLVVLDFFVKPEKII